MKYTKHMTLNEWNRFNIFLKDFEGNFVPPGNDYQFINHHTGKIESLETITGQEVLLTRYKIIIDEYEPKWTRRYQKIRKLLNRKNLIFFSGISLKSSNHNKVKERSSRKKAYICQNRKTGF